MSEKDTHTLLIEAIQEYYKVNETFEERKTKPWKIKNRKWLSEIRRLATIRRQEVNDDYLKIKAERILKSQNRGK